MTIPVMGLVGSAKFEIKLEHMLSACTTAAAATATTPALFYLRLVLETPNLVHNLGGPHEHF